MQFQRTNTILYCQKWTETVAFYRDVFDFRISHQTDWFVEFEVTPQVAYLSIADEQRASVKSVSGQGITLSWQVGDLQAIYQLLTERGVELGPIREKWAASLCYLHDPEGHRIELWQPLG
jgi:catechol 2,3-dioxygenase-like lactoylglutathione lyase family enzyme